MLRLDHVNMSSLIMISIIPSDCFMVMELHAFMSPLSLSPRLVCPSLFGRQCSALRSEICYSGILFVLRY